MFVFFDIDGTLLDQRGAEHAAAGMFLAEFGALLAEPCDPPRFCQRWKAIREQHLPAYLGGSISYREYHRRRIRDLFPDGPSLPARELDARYDVFHRGYRGAWQPFEDVRPALDRLQKGGPLGIISNGNARHQRSKLRRLGILERFCVVVISEEVGVGKPRRAIFVEACRRAGVAASRCLYVGDRIDHDVQPSIASGMRGIWLNRKEESPACPVETIRSLTELRSGLESSWHGAGEPTPAVLENSAGRELYSG